MTNTIQNTVTIKKQAVYSKDKKHRYELTLSLPDQKGKSILVLCLNPASDDLLITDSTTNYLMNNLFPSGYTTITLCNLFSTICGKLTIRDARDDGDANIAYLKSVLGRDFNAILVGYGNTFATNKLVAERKAQFDQFLKDSGKKAVELVDKEEKYARLRTIHPLFAGQRFSGSWKFRKYMIEKNKNIKEGTPDVHKSQQKKSANHTQKAQSVSGKTPTAERSASRNGENPEKQMPK